MIRRANNNIAGKNVPPEISMEVMNYLIQKLESRQKKVFKFKTIFKELDSFESFYSQRKEIYLLLNNLEEDLKQASFAIKALYIQNKALLKDISNRVNENKNMTNKLNFLVGENENLKMKLNSINENKLENIISYSNNINSMNINNQFKIDEEEEYEEPKTKNLNLKDNNKNAYMNINNIDIENFNDNQNNYEQLANVKNIIKDMRNNKKDLRNIIEKHFKEQKKLQNNNKK